MSKGARRYLFEGEMRTVREVHAMVGTMVSDTTVRVRLEEGETTIAQIRKPRPRHVNVAWKQNRHGWAHKPSECITITGDDSASK